MELPPGYRHSADSHTAWKSNSRGAARLAANSNHVLDVGYLDGL